MGKTKELLEALDEYRIQVQLLHQALMEVRNTIFSEPSEDESFADGLDEGCAHDEAAQDPTSDYNSLLD